VAVGLAEVLSAALGNHPPVLIFLAGPNGAGKSTFHQVYLAAFRIPFVNADVIRRELSAPREAAAEADAVAFRQAEEYRRAFLEAGTSFCTETVLAGYSVFLVFIGLAIPLVSDAFLFDNSSAEAPFRPVAVYQDGKLVFRTDQVPNWANGLPGL
jgi:predicted ABC-type ATPase